MARRLTYLVASFFLAVLGLVAAAPAAWAHATLVTQNPADGAIVRHAPASVSATFDQPVGVSPDSLQVFAPDGARVDTGGTTHGSKPQEIVVKLKSGLGRGTYTVGWHVISADSHPVQGAWTFSVGAPSKTSVNASSLNLTASPLVGFAFGVIRWVAFCSFALLIGAVAFVLWCWPAGASRPDLFRTVMGAWGGLAGSVLAALLLQGAYGAGEGVSRVFWPNVLHATLYSRYGRSLGIRLVLVVVALFVFTSILGNLRIEGRRPSGRTSVTWGALAAALAATWAAADHAGTGIQVPLSLVSDTIHLCSVAIWLGGLTMLATIVLRRPKAADGKPAARPADRKGRMATQEAARAVERFSPVALSCVGAIVITGTYQAWRGVGSWPALVDTTYGRLLLIKIGAMCLLIALGYLARVRIAALRAPASATPARAAELVVAGLPRVVAGGMTRNAGAATAAGDDAAGKGGSGAGASADGPLPDAGRTAVTLRRLRWSVGAEATIAAVVLAVTAVLVNTAPGRQTFTQPANAAIAFNTGGPGGRGSVSITVTPAVIGPNKITVTVTSSSGRPMRPKQVEVSLELPARHLGPLAIPLTLVGSGHYISKPVTLTITGQWRAEITIRSDAFDETSVFVPVVVH